MKALMILALLVGCATTNPPATTSLPMARTEYCGFVKTGQIAKDLAAPHRTDPEWYEAVIELLARHVDCLQGNGATLK